MQNNKTQVETIISNIIEPIKILELLKDQFNKTKGNKISEILERCISQLNTSANLINNLELGGKETQKKSVSNQDMEFAKKLLEEYKDAKAKLQEQNKNLKDMYEKKLELENNQDNNDLKNAEQEKLNQIKQLEMLMSKLQSLEEEKKRQEMLQENNEAGEVEEDTDQNENNLNKVD